MLVVGFSLFAQRLAEPKCRLSKMTDAPQYNEQETTTRTNRVAGNIIFEEYFNASDWSAASVDGVAVPANMPAGWSVFDATGNNFFWRWSTEGPRGPYTSYYWNVPNNSIKIKSTSDNIPGGEQGFIMFELDFYNCNHDTSDDVTMNSYIQMPVVSTTEYYAVNIYFEQYHRFCCANYSAEVGPKMYISNDSVNWARYDVHQASINATPVTNPSVYEVSVSNVAANQSTVYVRLHIKGETHYYWMVDDFVMYEPEPYDVRIMGYWVDYRDGKWDESYFKDGSLRPGWKKRFTGTPFYNPYFAFQEIVTSRAIAVNFGGESFHEAIITTKVVKEDGTVLDEKTSAVVSSIAPGEFDTSFVATHNFQIPKTIESVGSYYYEGVVSGAVEDEMPENNTYRYDFNITENVFGYANPLTAGTSRQSPFIISYSAVDGDGVAVEFFLNPPIDTIPGTEIPAPYVFRGINTYISNDGYNWDIWEAGDVAYLTAEVYESDTAGNYDLTAPIISSASIPIDSTMAGSWVFLPFIADGLSENITPTVEGQAYLAVIRFYTGSLRFFIGADKITQPSFHSNFFILGEDMGSPGTEINISMELIVDKYLSDPRGSVKVTVLTIGYADIEKPLYNSPVEIRVPNINENGELIGIDIVTQTTDFNGVVTFDNLRADSYTTVATLVYEGGSIAVDNWGNPIRKSAVVTVQGSGTYEVTIIINPFIGINDPNLLRNVKLYPVPSNNKVTIESPVNISRIVISNIVGQVVQTIENPTQIQTISVANYATGVYMVTLFDNNGNSTTQRLIKH